MHLLKHIESSTIFTTASLPVWASGQWNCGDKTFVDPTGTWYGVQTSPSALSQAQASIWSVIKSLRDSKKEYGGIHVGDYWFYSDITSITQYNTLLSMALELSLPVEYELVAYWKTMSGEFVTMTVGLLRSIRDAGIAIEVGNYAIAEGHRIAMLQVEDPYAYDYSTGWAETYEDTL